MIKLVRHLLAPAELKQQANEYKKLHRRIVEVRTWCANDSPEIGCAMQYLLHEDRTISQFREGLRNGCYTWDYYCGRMGF